MSALLHEKLAGVKVRQALVSATTGAAAAVIALICIFALTMFIDYWFDLPLVARAFFLIVNLAVVAYLLVRYAINPLLYGLDEESLALAVERSFPEISTRVIATIQLSRPDAITRGTSKSLVREMVKETEGLVNDLDFGQIVKLRQLLRFGGAASVIIVMAAAAFVYAGDTNTALLKRALLMPAPLPRKTHVYDTNGDFAAAIGDDVTLHCLVSGHKPATGTAYITYASGRKQEADMTRSANPSNRYEVTLASVQESFSYRLNVYDDTSESHNVTVYQRPAVQKIACTEIFPAYAHLAPLDHNISDLSFLVGSQMKLVVTATEPCRVNPADDGAMSRIKLLTADGKGHEFPLLADSTDPKTLTAQIPLPANAAGFSVQLVDARGLLSRDTVVYPIEMIEDRPPTIEILTPQHREILVTVEAAPSIQFQAQDDLGVASVSLHYQVEGGSDGTIPIYPGANPPATPSINVVQSFPWPIAKIPPAPGDPLIGTEIDYWLEVTDNCSPTPHVTDSEHYSAKIVSLADKKAELLDQISQLAGTLDTTTQSETQAKNAVGQMINGTPPENKP